MNACVKFLVVCGAMAALPVLAANLVVNPGFETGTFAGWSNQTEFSIVTNTPHTGADCAQCIATATRALMQDIPITPPADGITDFVISYWYLKTNGNVRIWSRWAPTNYTGTTITPGSYNPAAPEWRQMVYTNRPAAGATNFHFEVRVYNGANVLLDDFVLESIGSGDDPNIVITPSTLDFGVVAIERAVTNTFLFGNTGAHVTLTNTAFTPTAGATDRFGITPPAPVLVPPGGAVTMTVVFAAGSIPNTNYNATFTITSNDPADPAKPVSFSGRSAAPAPVWVNEIETDDPSVDDQEFIELAGYAGTNLLGWKIELYNGNAPTNPPYAAHTIGAFTLSNKYAADGRAIGFFVLVPTNSTIVGDETASFSSIQNGPDAVCLRDPGGAVVHFFEYGSATPTTFAQAGTPDDWTALVDTSVSNTTLAKWPQPGEWFNAPWANSTTPDEQATPREPNLPEPATLLLALAAVAFVSRR